MEYKKIIILLGNTPNKYTNRLNLVQKIGLKYMMMHMKRIAPIVKLNLKI